MALCLLCGVLSTLAFPKWDLKPLVWISLVPLFFALREKDSKKSLFIGWLAGGFAGFGQLYWIVGTISGYSEIPWIVAVFLLALLSAATGAFWGAWAFFTERAAKKWSFPVLLAAPGLWVLVEYGRAILTAFPWNYLGYALVDGGPFVQAADVGGLYGLSFLVVLGNAALYEISRVFATREGEPKILPQILPALLSLLLPLAAFVYGAARKPQIEGQINAAPEKFRVALVQPNVPQVLKWDDEHENAMLLRHEQMSRELLGKGRVDLLVWPEAAFTFFPTDPEAPLWVVRRLSEETRTPILFGAPNEEQRGEEIRYSNSVLLMEPGVESLQRYDKIKLVPFGEYVPFSNVFFFLKKLVEVGAGDFTPGDSPVLLSTGKIRAAPLVCYEAIFPGLVRKFTGEGSNLLVNITNDAWFGKTSAPYQHLSMARLRTIETRSWMVRAANTGITAAITPTGALVDATELETQTYRIVEVGEDLGETAYEYFGDWIVLACALFFAFTGLKMKFTPKRPAA
ncbi:MAG: apolipoprotein N-acyltransferase [Bdellovibrionota bacterium]